MIISSILSSLSEDESALLLFVINRAFKTITEDFDLDNIKFIRQDVLKAKLLVAEQHIKEEHKELYKSLCQKLNIL